MVISDSQKRTLDALDVRYASLDPRQALPSTLYHYTTGAGLLGILKSHRLRATHFAYLNDAAELRYGTSLARQVLDAALRDEVAAAGKTLATIGIAPDEQVVTALSLLGSIFEGFDSEPTEDFYITSFCSEPDLLSQWRGYGSHGSRYAIGFDAEALSVPSEPTPAALWQAVYDRAEQERRLRVMIEKAIAIIKEHRTPDTPRFPNRVAGRLAVNVIRMLCAFKHEGFREESEWRLVHEQWGSTRAPVRFDANAQGIIRPFVEFGFNRQEQEGPGRLPIVEVVVGSTPYRHDKVKVSTEQLLKSQGYEDVHVRVSDVPYRG